MEINLNDVPEIDLEKDICAICHENLEDNIAQIPECNHKFHSECVITWFRMGKSKCPYCNTEFAHKKKSTPPRHIFRRNLICEEYKDIYNYSRRKNANPKIKKQVKKITDLNKSLITITKEFNKMIKSDKSYKEVMKYKRKYRDKKWRLKRKIYSLKRKVVSYVNIIPIIVQKKIKVDI
jgi:hypothetical protein